MMMKKKTICYFSMLLLGCICMSSVFAVNENLISTLKNMTSNNPASIKPVQPTNNNPARFAFILFYMSSCPHCQRFDPILRVFSEKNHVPVLAYTLDGKSLSSFPNSINPDQSEILKFFPNKNPVVPTLFLIDEVNHKIYPVLQGEATMDQLSMRFSQLTNQSVTSSNKEMSNTASVQDFNYAQNN